MISALVVDGQFMFEPHCEGALISKVVVTEYAAQHVRQPAGRSPTTPLRAPSAASVMHARAARGLDRTLMAITATKDSIHLRVVHPSWQGKVLYGTIVSVPNRWHADINTPIGVLRAAQASLVWQQDWKPK
jgi:hypothetical protein